MYFIFEEVISLSGVHGVGQNWMSYGVGNVVRKIKKEMMTIEVI
jgi:hypothetical protein